MMEHLPDDRPDIPGKGRAATPPPILRRHADQLLQVVEPVVAVARGFTTFFFSAALLSMLGAVVLLLVLFVPFEVASFLRVALMGVTAALLLLPGLVLLLFWVGLTQLIAIPEQIADSIGQVDVHSAAAYAASSGGSGARGRFGRLVMMLKSLVDVRAVLLQSRDLFVRGAVLVRVANPVSLIVVLGATVASLLIIAVAAVVALAVLL